MLVWSRDSHLSEFPYILGGVGGIVGLVIIRQILSFNENSRLYTVAQREIDERRKSEEVLGETRDYLENLIGYANELIIVLDPSFRISRLNHAFKRLTGLEDEEVLGKPLDLLFPESSRERSLACIRHTLSGERLEAVKIPIRAKNPHDPRSPGRMKMARPRSHFHTR